MQNFIIKDKNDFLKSLSFSVYKLKGNKSFRLEELIQDDSLIIKYKNDIDKLISECFFFIKHDEDAGDGFYKKTYRIPEICHRTIQELKDANINKDILDFINTHPLILHTEFVKWLNTKHKSMLSFILDKYWHNFMIYSYEYKSWSLDNLGYFLHHVPTPEYEKKETKLETIILDNALFFSEYRKKFPISESILLYNLPYKLYNNSLSFKKIKNIVFDITNELVNFQHLNTTQIDSKKINNLVEQTKLELNKKGFCWIKNLLSLDEYNFFVSKLGTVINFTTIEIKKDSMRKFNSHHAMPLHTDAHDVDIIAWFCKKQDNKDGKTILKDLRHYRNYFTEHEIEVLKTIPIRYPIYKRFYTGTNPLLENNKFYYAPWLELDSYNEEQSIILNKFNNFIEEQDEILIDMKECDVLVIDNTFMLHGRNDIDQDSDRVLYRTHISL